MVGNHAYMGQTKAIYVRDEDIATWDRAEAYARSRRTPMSGLIMIALERLLEEDIGPPARTGDDAES